MDAWSRDETTVTDPNKEIADLIDAWCQRRALGPLRQVLPHWPHNGLTMESPELKKALENARALGRDELTPAEGRSLDKLISAIDLALTRRS